MPEKPEGDTKSDLTQIIVKALPDFTSAQIRYIKRLGKNPPKKKARPILVGLSDAGARDLLIS